MAKSFKPGQMIELPKGWEIGFKVVDQHRRSAIVAWWRHFNGVPVPSKDKKGVVRYYKTRPTVPHADCGPLAVFNTWNNAEGFRNRILCNDAAHGRVRKLQILPCIYEPWKPKGSMPTHLWFWIRSRTQPKKFTKRGRTYVPRGTRFAKQVLVLL